MSASLFLSGVSASFGARPLFSGLQLRLTPGDVTALVGPNGAGKTTLLPGSSPACMPRTPARSGSLRRTPPWATCPRSRPHWTGTSSNCPATYRGGAGQSLRVRGGRVGRPSPCIIPAHAGNLRTPPNATTMPWPPGWHWAVPTWIPVWPRCSPVLTWTPTSIVHSAACPAARLLGPDWRPSWSAATTCCCSMSRRTTWTPWPGGVDRVRPDAAGTGADRVPRSGVPGRRGHLGAGAGRDPAAGQPLHRRLERLPRGQATGA